MSDFILYIIFKYVLFLFFFFFVFWEREGGKEEEDISSSLSKSFFKYRFYFSVHKILINL